MQLDQNFNSLDAQHEACANYIASQKSEGWMMLKDNAIIIGKPGTGKSHVAKAVANQAEEQYG